jgi:hypothetical protein
VTYPEFDNTTSSVESSVASQAKQRLLLLLLLLVVLLCCWPLCGVLLWSGAVGLPRSSSPPGGPCHCGRG